MQQQNMQLLSTLLNLVVSTQQRRLDREQRSAELAFRAGEAEKQRLWYENQNLVKSIEGTEVQLLKLGESVERMEADRKPEDATGEGLRYAMGVKANLEKQKENLTNQLNANYAQLQDATFGRALVEGAFEDYVDLKKGGPPHAAYVMDDDEVDKFIKAYEEKEGPLSEVAKRQIRIGARELSPTQAQRAQIDLMSRRIDAAGKGDITDITKPLVVDFNAKRRSVEAYLKLHDVEGLPYGSDLPQTATSFRGWIEGFEQSMAQSLSNLSSYQWVPEVKKPLKEFRNAKLGPEKIEKAHELMVAVLNNLPSTAEEIDFPMLTNDKERYGFSQLIDLYKEARAAQFQILLLQGRSGEAQNLIKEIVKRNIETNIGLIENEGEKAMYDEYGMKLIQTPFQDEVDKAKKEAEEEQARREANAKMIQDMFIEDKSRETDNWFYNFLMQPRTTKVRDFPD